MHANYLMGSVKGMKTAGKKIMFAINLSANTPTLIVKWVSAASTRFLLNRQPITAINHGEKAPSGKSLFQWKKRQKVTQKKETDCSDSAAMYLIYP